MKYLPLLISVAVAISSLAAAKPIDSTASAAIQEAERFVTRHGYTAAGHPGDRPVQRTSLHDGLYRPEELIAARKGVLSEHAACVRTHPDGSHTVLFQSTKDATEFWFVALGNEEQPYLGHQPVSRSTDCAAVDGAVP